MNSRVLQVQVHYLPQLSYYY